MAKKRATKQGAGQEKHPSGAAASSISSSAASSTTPAESKETDDTLPILWPDLHIPAEANYSESHFSPPPKPVLSTLLPSQILVTEKLLSRAVCDEYVSFLTGLPLSVTQPNARGSGLASRVNDRFQIQDVDFAQRLWTDTGLDRAVAVAAARGEDFGGIVLGLNSNIRIYRYRPGQYFAKHYDDFNTLNWAPSADSDTTVPAITTWTLLVYLTSCTGGETVFYPEPTVRRPPLKTIKPAPIEVAPKVGYALLHRHGDACMLHEARKVTEGEKWVIRSDVCVRR